MSTALPRPTRPLNGPPNVALPALPVGKVRRSAGATPVPSTPNSGLGALTFASGIPSTTSKTLRKTVSINSFPQPPRGDYRVTSLPPSPLSAGATRKSRGSSASSYQFVPTTSSLLNGTGEGRLAARNSDGLISVSSPPHSRSSSAQESYSTSATQYEDLVDVPPSRTDEGSRRTSKADSKGNVVVSVRVRPDAAGKDHTIEGEWMVDSRKSLIRYRGKDGGDYYYDNVLTTHDDNSKVYDQIAKRLVRRVMEGYHGTVFAYGMTGTGKTFSMQGTASSPGVIPLAITDIFSYIRETPSREFLLRVSYLEIYNEKIHDLLSMPTGSGLGQHAHEDIKLREDNKRGVYATPLKEEIVQSPTQLLRVIARGDQARRTASTQFNARSSRSHAVVQIVVESRERISAGAGESRRQAMLPGGVRVSTLSLIDLAGSEKAAETKERRQEGSHINKSLLTLGTVVARLSEHKEKDEKPADKDGKHLPYRDSKLTRLLQGALSGDSLVSILCTIQVGLSGSAAATSGHPTETINTLKFASRAKNNIVSHARRAEEALGASGDGDNKVLLERYRMEIVELRKELEAQSNKKSRVEVEANGRDEQEERAREREHEHRHEEQMLEMQLARTALKERIDHLNRLILSSKSIGVNASGFYSALGIQSSRFSQASVSVRSSMAASITGVRSPIERSSSMTSPSSTIGRRCSGHAASSGPETTPVDDQSSMTEIGDGNASLAAQNWALQADLADKNRYIQTLEKRLLHARRASASKTLAGISGGSASAGGAGTKGGIMVGEDHSVSTLLKEKDAEIAELRVQLEDKNHMLTALRSAARSRDNADRLDSRAELRLPPQGRAGLKAVLDSASTNSSPSGASSAEHFGDSPTAIVRCASSLKKRARSPDEMCKILDEIIQDRLESGQLVRSMRGSVRVPSTQQRVMAECSNSFRGGDDFHGKPTMTVSSPDPPIQLQLLAARGTTSGGEITRERSPVGLIRRSTSSGLVVHGQGHGHIGAPAPVVATGPGPVVLEV